MWLAANDPLLHLAATLPAVMLRPSSVTPRYLASNSNLVRGCCHGSLLWPGVRGHHPRAGWGIETSVVAVVVVVVGTVVLVIRSTPVAALVISARAVHRAKAKLLNATGFVRNTSLAR